LFFFFLERENTKAAETAALQIGALDSTGESPYCNHFSPGRLLTSVHPTEAQGFDVSR
jgi:hypothetical protein